MSTLAKTLVNTGASLYRKNQYKLAEVVWSTPSILSHSSSINIKNYLSLCNDFRFNKYVSRNYLKIVEDDVLLAWVSSEARARSLEELSALIEKSMLSDNTYLLGRLRELWKEKAYDSIKLIASQSRPVAAWDDIVLSNSDRLILAVSLNQIELIPKAVNYSDDDVILRQIFNYYRAIKKEAPSAIENIASNNKAFLSEKFHYAFCQYSQALLPINDSIANWESFIEKHPGEVRAYQNLLIQYSKINNPKLVDTLLYLDDKNSLNDKLIASAFRSLNRQNSVALLDRVKNIKKKNHYADKVKLEIYRKNDYMSEVNRLQSLYEKNYGTDPWLKTFIAKKFIDYGDYVSAVKHFKALKGQKLYYGVSLLRNKQLDKAYRVFKKIKRNSTSHHGACRYMADINFYEYGNWSKAKRYYEKSLDYKFEYQLNLRKLKSMVLLGQKLNKSQIIEVNREDIFYLRYIEEIVAGNKVDALKYLSQIYSDYNAKPLRYKEANTFFDSINSQSKKNKSDLKVSVVMTAYKAVGVIDFAILSILNQSHSNIELIIVEDNSPDNTYEYLCDKYSSVATILRTEKNSGTYVAKNIGISHATGDYITFMDSDDWSHPNRISIQVRIMNENKHAIACQTGHLRMLENGDLLFRKRGVNLEVPISLMFRPSLVDDIGFFDSVRASGDSEFIGRIKTVYGSESIKYINCPLIIARQAEGSLTTSGPTALTWAGMPAVRIDYRRSFREWHRKEGELKIGINNQKREFNAPAIILSKQK